MGIENPVHLLFIAAVALIVLGPKRLPELGRALGQGIREFRESLAAGAQGEHPSQHAQVAPAQMAPVSPALAVSSGEVAPSGEGVPSGDGVAPARPLQPGEIGHSAADERGER
jgi:sec-independent protein translocase protein TatA